MIFGLPRVDGWLEAYSARFIGELAAIQRDHAVVGAVGEIGVHHGKLFILLLLSASDREKAFAIDVFERQDLNTDHSGCGNRDVFLANVRRWAGSDTNVSLIAQSSLEVRPASILEQCGRVRLASVDGGHTEACTFHDLALMEAVLRDRGVVVIDDYFNPHWPDVSAGVVKYLSQPDTALRPFAISPNKLYLTTVDSAAFYRTEIQKRFESDKESVMFGSHVDIYGIRQPKATLLRFVRERLKQSSIGPYLLAAKRRLFQALRIHVNTILRGRPLSA